ncbi:MAG: hypothetical protein QM831_44405 [Kofleriaceae bacterium]
MGKLDSDVANPLIDASNPNSEIFITQSPPGPDNGNMASWLGVLQFSVRGDGAALAAGTGLDKTMVEDPVDAVFRSASSELLISNRHGNNSADGVAGSISRFKYDQGTHALTSLGEITGNGLAGVHQIIFSPTTGELFAANVNTAISRFTFNGDTPTPNGTISDGPTRGVFVSPDGARLYQTTASNVIRQWDLATNTELTPITFTTTENFHFFGYRKGDLYVAGLDGNHVYRFHIEGNDDLTMVETIDADAPIGIAFSADGEEMFITGHRTSDIVQRYTHQADDTWAVNGTSIDLGSSLGGIAILPG